MAKAKRRVTDQTQASPTTFGDQPAWIDWCRRAAAALLGGTLVYLAYHPSDSVQVERGDALWFVVLALLLWTTVFASEPFHRHWMGESIKAYFGIGTAIDLLAWSLAVWMAIAAFAVGLDGQLRQATNEAWLWIGGAAFFTAARRLLADQTVRAAVMTVVFAIAVGMAVHALHQHWVSLPQLRSDYLEDPEATLQAAGVSAPENSAARMVFANRLLDGGPTATFVLANSLAAFLTVCVIVPLAVIRERGLAVLRRADGVFLVLVALAGAAALIATRSRSALGACLLAIAWWWFFTGNANGTPFRVRDAKWSGRLIAAVASVLISAGLLTLGIVLLGDNEWLAAAPGSLQFRLQYWKSTSAMVMDHPIFGAGPGGFQSMYLTYRLPVARETIADPHNFIFETLASGGVPAAILLVALVGRCVRFARRSSARVTLSPDTATVSRDQTTSIENRPDAEGIAGGGCAAWVIGGAAVALSLVWVFGLLSNQAPDIPASVFAVPVAIAVGWWCYRGPFDWSDNDQSVSTGSTMAAIMVAVMIHLLVSGGWTVPGVAVLVWLSAAMLTVPNRSAGPQRSVDIRTRKRAAVIAFGFGATLVIALRFLSIVPVQNAQLALARSEDALMRGMPARVASETALAVAADRWDHRAAMWRSEWLKNQLVAGEDKLRLRSDWQQATDTALQRAPGDPIVAGALANQAIQLYQRFGRSKDLQMAWRWLQRGLAGNPTDEALVAQAAAVADQLGRTEEAKTLADQATALSQLGNNIVRDLGLVHILAVKQVGKPATGGPIWVSAKEDFADRFGPKIEP